MVSHFSRWWTLFLLGCIYFVGELGHFLLGSVARQIAQDLSFGDKSCLKLSQFQNLSSNICTSGTNQYECGNITVEIASKSDARPCTWTYNGLGLPYHLLAGPAFMAVYTISACVWGYVADKWNRIWCLSTTSFFFSSAIVATSLATTYWHVFVARMALAIWVSSCTPLAAGIIADLFPPQKRGLAMGLFHWGIYIGYGSSFAIGNYVTAANIFEKGWRASYVVSGIPGFAAAFILFCTVKEPRTSSRKEDKKGRTDLPKAQEIFSETTLSVSSETMEDEKGLLQAAKNPALILLVLGACARHAGGFCWAYNSALYFKTYYPDYDAATWLTSISIGGGILSVLVGGWLSDVLSAKIGKPARPLILAISQLVASPFTFSQFLVQPPTAMYFVLVGYLSAEMWFGVMFALLVELLPKNSRSKGIAIALFCINNVGGITPVLVNPIAQRFSYRVAVTILYPGALLLSSLLFFSCFIVLWKQEKGQRVNSK